MKNATKSLIFALKHDFLVKFSKDFFFEEGVTGLCFEISPDLTENEYKLEQRRPHAFVFHLLSSFE